MLPLFLLRTEPVHRCPQIMFPTAVRLFARKGSPKLMSINPKAHCREATETSKGLSQIIKDNAPLTGANKSWNRGKKVAIGGLDDQTHTRIMRKWMRGKKKVKQFCTHSGSAKKFLQSPLPDEPQTNRLEEVLKTVKPSVKSKTLRK